jgi:membrane protease YdiL (CAAX protease family)
MKISRDSAITLTVFLALTIVLYFVGYWLIFRLGRSTPLMLSVGVAAILTCLIRRRRLSSLGWRWGEWKYQWMSYFIPLAMVSVSYLLIWLADFGGWYNTQFVLGLRENYNLVEWTDASVISLHFLITATISFAVTLPSVLGEEIAWRGLLVGELSKFMSFTGVSLVSGFVWAVWHWPLIIAGIYGGDATPLYYQLLTFTLYIMAGAMIMTYLRYKSGSVWTAVVFHMSGNVFMQKVFTPLTIEHENSVWYMDEFGLVPLFVAILFAIYFWRKGTNEFRDKTALT